MSYLTSVYCYKFYSTCVKINLNASSNKSYDESHLHFIVLASAKQKKITNFRCFSSISIRSCSNLTNQFKLWRAKLFLISNFPFPFVGTINQIQCTCVLESDFGFSINCNFKKSGLFRVRNLGGVKAHFGLGKKLQTSLTLLTFFDCPCQLIPT